MILASCSCKKMLEVEVGYITQLTDFVEFKTNYGKRRRSLFSSGGFVKKNRWVAVFSPVSSQLFDEGIALHHFYFRRCQ